MGSGEFEAPINAKILQKETTVVRSYFNNHYGAKAVVNALQLT